jgi:hypothetical protein
LGTLFKQIQGASDFTDAGEAGIGTTQQLSVTYTNIIATGHVMSDCRHWNDKADTGKTSTFSRLSSLQHIITSSSKCKENLPRPPGKIQLMEQWQRMNMTWHNPPLMMCLTW